MLEDGNVETEWFAQDGTARFRDLTGLGYNREQSWGSKHPG